MLAQSPHQCKSVMDLRAYRLFMSAAILLPIDVALRRLRVSFDEIKDWLRHPGRVGVTVALPSFLSRAGTPETPLPTWLPGLRTRPKPVQPLSRPLRTEVITSSAVTPALAREQDGDTSDEDALAETLRWLAARRRGRPEG